MASWGQPAVGGERYTGLFPSRSAILGLMAAALGISRDNGNDLDEISQSVSVASKVISHGQLLRDYHTTQAPKTERKRNFSTRKQELELGTLSTVLSSRDYRCDAIWIVALYLKEGAHYSLEQFRQALLKPVYPLYLGRKSCPLAIPVMPKIVQTDNLRQALDTKFPSITVSEASDRYFFHGYGHDRVETYFWEGNSQDFGDHQDEILAYQIWDEPIDRQRWQFTQRWQYQVSIAVEERK